MKKVLFTLLPCYIVTLLLLLLTLLLFTKPALARQLTSGDIDLHTHTGITTNDIVSGLTCQVIGYDPANPDGAGCTYYNQSGVLEAMEKPGGGAVAFTGNLIAAMYANPPASGVQYLADLGKNLGIVQPAYAAVPGVGWSGLQPILPIWKAFRNIAYLFFVIVFIAIGFAIMFRVKISPQAVITIQSALPRIVIALILVTFSYAIAGFLIDLMYVLIELLTAVLGEAGIQGPQVQVTGGFGEAIKGVFGALFGWWQLPGIGGVLPIIIGIILMALGHPVLGLIGLVGGGLVLLILGLILLYLLFKLFIELLKAYIGIIFGVIFAPLQIMLGAIPGIGIDFGSWFRGLLANILVFPAVAIFLLIGGALIKTSGSNLWAPPMLTFPSQVIPAIIGLGILFMVYKIPEMVKEAVGVKPFKYGAAIGEVVRFGAKPVTYPAGIIRAGVERGVGEEIATEVKETDLRGRLSRLLEKMRT